MKAAWLFAGLLLPLLFPMKEPAAQAPFFLELEEVSIPQLPGLQSFAAAQYNGRWILIGGRTDGLHMKQPFASFHPDYNNTQIVVVDVQKRNVQTASLLQLPDALAEQLQSSNMQFVQQGSWLYLVGGYGFSASQKKFVTHPRLTAVNLPALIEAIENKRSIKQCFITLEDERMAVTGGGLGLLQDEMFLVGGQRFTGRYNPHGPNHGPGFVQQYTNAIRRFRVHNNGSSLIITNYSESKDTAELHRRDYNLVPQYFGPGQPGFTAFAGVFQYTKDVPWLHPVEITPGGYKPQPQFQQKFNHYHSAHLPLYSKKDTAMHTLFFGGIAQFYLQNGKVLEDAEVPFVNTISRVTRLPNGRYHEEALPVQLPALLGAGAWMARNENLPVLWHDIIDWDALPRGKHLLGYIVGGIRSSAPNIFWPNTGKQSSASATVLAVYVTR